MNKLIISFLCIFGAAALGFFVIWPQYNELQPKQDSIKNKTLQLADQKEYYEELAKIEQELKNYPEELSKIEMAFPEDFSLPSMYDYLQKKASEAGLILRGAALVSDSAPSENGRIKEQFMNLSLSGSYSALKNFALILENSARLIEVQELSFASPALKNSPVAASVMVKFNTY